LKKRKNKEVPMQKIENINLKLARIFYEMSEIYQFQKVKWKPQAYIIAGQTLESLNKNLKDLYKQGGQKAIEALPGIGPAIAQKIIEYIQTGKVKHHEELKNSVPKGIYTIMKLQGVGPKKAEIFYNKLGIKSKTDLEQALKKHKLSNLPGFKEKSEQNLIEAIELSKHPRDRMPLKKAQVIANNILSKLKSLSEVEKISIAGSLRRKKPLVRDLDFVVQTKNSKKVIDAFVKMPFVKKVISKGLKKAGILTKENLQVEMRLTDADSYGACLLYFTGDKSHNIWLRKIAIKKGFKLNEYGLFDKKTNKRVAGKTEEEIYKKLGVKILQPHERIGETLIKNHYF